MNNGIIPQKVKSGGKAVVQGQVKSYPVEFNENTSYIVQCESVESSGRKWRSRERINVVATGKDAKTDVYPGLTLRVSGKVVIRENSRNRLSAMGAVAELSAIPGSLEVINRGGLFSRVIEKIRSRLEKGIDRAFDRSVSAMVKGFSLGSMNELDSRTRDDLNGSGLSHIVAVSGMHIASVMAIIIVLAGILGFGRRAGFSAAVTLALIIVAISGFRPSAVRSLIMVFAGMAAGLAGRRHDAYTGFSLAGIFILLLNPKALFDLGFQFSFAAVLGIFMVARNIKIKGLTRGLVAVWAGAQIGILPVMLLHSKQIPVASLPANMFVVPFFGPALMISICAAGISYLSIPAGKIIAMPSVIYTNSLLWISNRISAFPKARISLFIPGIALIVFCVSLFMIARGIRRNDKLHKALAVMFISLLILYLPGQFATSFSGGNRMVVLDVGQGDSILIQDETGVSVLVDGGPDGDVLVEKMHKYGIRKIDLIVLTHPHQDHISGLVSVISRFPVGGILMPRADNNISSSFRELKTESVRKGIRRMEAEAGQMIKLSEQCSLNVLFPEAGSNFETDNLNNSSTVIMCKLKNARALLMGDAELEAQGLLIKEYCDLDCEILKVPHQGSSDSASPEFIEECLPEIAVISVGLNNEYGHPSKKCLGLLGDKGIKTFRTDKMGDIVISVNEDKVSVKAERGGK